MTKIGVVGCGTVGSFLKSILEETNYSVEAYDKLKAPYNGPEQQRRVNDCELVFIAVPTPTTKEGADLSAVEEAVSWIERPMCIKSTIVPGTTDRLVATTRKEIVFSPEYIGETPYHKYRRTHSEEVIAIGGNRETAEKFVGLYTEIFGPEPHYFVADAVTVELAKYMENCFLATKVAFVSQFYLLAEMFGCDFRKMREIWVADSRIGRSHSTVMKELGFGGRCLPKDIDALIMASRQFGAAPLLEAVAEFNRQIRMDGEIPSPAEQRQTVAAD